MVRRGKGLIRGMNWMIMTTGAIYCRYSSDKQREASLEDHERTCRRRAEQEGWTVVHVYSDAAIRQALDEQKS
jgi:hypothetical protein